MTGTEPIRLFVGTDVWQQRYGAEAALLASIEDNTQGPVEVTWMRATPWAGCSGLPPFEWFVHDAYVPGVWNCACEPGDVYPEAGTRKGWGWATPFTGFRWAIPELCGFQGWAIYQDADMVDVGDLRVLLAMGRRSERAVYLAQGKACVMVLDCAAFGGIEWWPSIEQQRVGGSTMYDIRGRLDAERRIDATMPRAWNTPDRYEPGVMICHYTNARTQPWGAYRHKFGVKRHPNPNAVALWERYLARAKELGIWGAEVKT